MSGRVVIGERSGDNRRGSRRSFSLAPPCRAPPAFGAGLDEVHRLPGEGPRRAGLDAFLWVNNEWQFGSRRVSNDSCLFEVGLIVELASPSVVVGNPSSINMFLVSR